MQRRYLGQIQDSESKPHLAELRWELTREDATWEPWISWGKTLQSLWQPTALAKSYSMCIWFLSFLVTSYQRAGILSSLEGSMKDLRPFHPKPCLAPDDFLLLHGHLFPVHRTLRWARMGRKKTLSQRAVGWKGDQCMGHVLATSHVPGMVLNWAERSIVKGGRWHLYNRHSIP